MNENTLRVVQALEIKDSFEYVLRKREIDWLRSNGYVIEARKSDCFVWFYNCTIKRGVS